MPLLIKSDSTRDSMTSQIISSFFIRLSVNDSQLPKFYNVNTKRAKERTQKVY